MALGRPKAPLMLTTSEQETLASWAHRSRTAPQVARRARIVLACARGFDNQTVAKKVRVSPQMEPLLEEPGEVALGHELAGLLKVLRHDAAAGVARHVLLDGVEKVRVAENEAQEVQPRGSSR